MAPPCTKSNSPTIATSVFRSSVNRTANTHLQVEYANVEETTELKQAVAAKTRRYDLVIREQFRAFDQHFADRYVEMPSRLLELVRVERLDGPRWRIARKQALLQSCMVESL